MDQPVHLVALLGITGVCGLIAGSILLYLSSFNPVFVLKGIRQKRSAALIRKGLVVLQLFGFHRTDHCRTIIIFLSDTTYQSRNLGFTRIT